MGNKNFEVVILLDYKRLDELKYSIKFIKKHIECVAIVVITSRIIEDEIKKMGLNFVDEDSVFPSLLFENVKKYMISLGGKTSRTGWYFQQFLKMGYSYQCKYDYYVVWDSDTIPIKKIDFLQDEKMLFNMKNEHHKPYFSTIDKIFNKKLKFFKRNYRPSFISESMIFKVSIMKELIKCISSADNLEGHNFWQKIMSAIDRKNLSGSGFSEFETYGSYLITYYPNLYQERTLCSERFGYSVFGHRLSEEDTKNLSLDMISFEIWDKNNPKGKLALLYRKWKDRLAKKFDLRLYDF